MFETMEMPKVSTIFHDRYRDVRYQFIAYRRLSTEELLSNVRQLWLLKKKRPKRGSLVQIVTSIGFND